MEVNPNNPVVILLSRPARVPIEGAVLFKSHGSSSSLINTYMWYVEKFVWNKKK